MMSNKGLNSKEALDESTATNSSVTLSGIRREKEAPTDLDITDYSRNPGNSEPGRRDQKSQAAGAPLSVNCILAAPAALDRLARGCTGHVTRPTRSIRARLR